MNQENVPVPNTPMPGTPTPVNTPSPASGMPAGPTPMQPHSSASMKLIWIIVGAATAIIIALLLAWVVIMIASPSRAASSYLKAVQTKDYDKALKLMDAASDDASARSFVEGMSDNVGTSQKEVDHGKKDKQRGYVYEITGGESKYARVIVEKKSGWKVVNFITSNDKPSTFPGTSSSSATPSTPSTTTTTCLVNSDYATLLSSAATTDYKFSTSNKYTDNYFFQPDSTAYVYGDVTVQKTARYADFYKKNATKTFTIELSGSVYRDYQTASGTTLAQQRAEKVKQELIAAGIPAARIKVLAPQDYPYGQRASFDPSIFRNIRIQVDPTCTGSTGSGL